MIKPEIDLAHDHIMICGTRVDRPSTMSPSQWLEFWDPYSPPPCEHEWERATFSQCIVCGEIIK